MRANKGQSPDEIRERYLGEIAPLLAAARKVEALSPEQKKQVRRRVMRTVFGSRSRALRFRLTPVMVGVGLLVAGGVAFATAERLGFIHRADQGPPNTRATDADSHKRKGARPKPGAKLGAGDAHGSSEDETGVLGPQVSDPLGGGPVQGSAPPSFLMVPLSPTARPVETAEPRAASPVQTTAKSAATVEATQASQTLLPRRAPLAVSPTPLSAAPAASDPAGGVASRSGKAARKLALATPYLAEPAGPSPAAWPGSDSRGIPVTAMPAYVPPPSWPPVPPPARSPAAAAPPSTPSLPAVQQSPKVSFSDPALFGQALRKLRNEHDPTQALAALQQHEQTYPRSAFSGERSVLEVEALLALHREREALQKLDGMRLDGLPRSGERFVVRGELRAAARRWLDAKEDFDRALSRVSGSPTWHERALWGRGVARLRCGEQQAGMADIERYHDTYPDGRFAAEASRFFPGK